MRETDENGSTIRDNEPQKSRDGNAVEGQAKEFLSSQAKRAARFAFSIMEAALQAHTDKKEEMAAQEIITAFEQTRDFVFSNWKSPENFNLANVLAVGKEIDASYQEMIEIGDARGWRPLEYDPHRHSLVRDLNVLIDKAIAGNAARPSQLPPK